MLSKFTLAAVAAALLSPASAFIRFDCANNLVEERADPIVEPGQVSKHAHKIAGGNGFGFEMSFEQARASKCSSCPIKQDLSNYWTPKLYYQAQDGTFQSVRTVGDSDADLNGGMTVYYLQRGPNAKKVGGLKAFPAGFRMFAGTANKRNSTGGFEAEAVNYACLGANKPETNELPNYNCPGGLRAQIFFPSCWDGVNLDSPDHKSHMSYPAKGAYNNGECPSSHPVQLVSLFFEILYDTPKFASKWYGNNHPFVFANGDANGGGFHGDFVNGWDVQALQDIVDTCTDDNAFGSLEACSIVQKFTDAEQNNCRLPPHIDEQVAGKLPALPGCNPVSRGPEPADPNPVCDGYVPPVIGQGATYYTDLTTSKGWGYAGCAADGDPRTLADKTSIYSAGFGDDLTVEKCADWCAGFKYFGLEYSTQCFCGNNVAADRVPQEGILGNCNMKCKGDDGQYCGGPGALSLYQKCAAGATCVNAGFGGHNATLPAEIPKPAASAVPNPAGSTVPKPVASTLPEPVKAAVPEPVDSAVPESAGSILPEPIKATVPKPASSTVPKPADPALPNPEGPTLPYPVDSALPKPESSTLVQAVASAVAKPVSSTRPRPTKGSCASE